MFRFSFLFFSLLWLTSCNGDSQPTERSFCFWTTTYKTDTLEAKAEKLGARHLYLRYFDVDWSEGNGGPVPKAPLSLYGFSSFAKWDMTASVFFTPAVFEQMKMQEVPAFVDKFIRYLGQKDKELEASIKYFYSESQYRVEESLDYAGQSKRADSLAKAIFPLRCRDLLIDYDWSAKSREVYFEFLKQVRSRLGHRKELVVTIRLWQYKDANSSGIPPADKGLLMCYGLGRPDEYRDRNPIATAEGLKPWLDAPAYPLPLDIALPIFNWPVLFRAGQFKSILPQLAEKDALADTLTWDSLGTSRYQLKVDTVIGDLYARTGDELRLQQVTPAELEAIAKLVKEKINPGGGSRITLFSLTEENLARYTPQELKKIYEIFE